MPIYTFGWVDVTRLDDSDVEEDYAWSGLIDLSVYIDAVDEVAEVLFGYSKRILRGEYHVEAFAKDRGLPKNPSPHLKREIENISEDHFGFTHIYFHEIQKINWSNYQFDDPDSDWFRLISLLNKLLEENRFQANKIRIVVWFYW